MVAVLTTAMLLGSFCFATVGASCLAIAVVTGVLLVTSTATLLVVACSLSPLLWTSLLL